VILTAHSHHPDQKKINRETLELNDIVDQIDLIDIYRTFHPTVTEFIVLSTAYGMLSQTDYT
jgi:hypothetical protein